MFSCRACFDTNFETYSVKCISFVSLYKSSCRWADLADADAFANAGAVTPSSSTRCYTRQSIKHIIIITWAVIFYNQMWNNSSFNLAKWVQICIHFSQRRAVLKQKLICISSSSSSFTYSSSSSTPYSCSPTFFSASSFFLGKGAWKKTEKTNKC